MLRGAYQNDLDAENSNVTSMPVMHTDLARLQAGKIGCQFWSAYVPCPTMADGDDPTNQSLFLPSLLHTLQQIDVIRNLVEKYPKVLGMASSANEIVEVFESGRVASLIGVEGLHQIGNSASVLRNFHRLGVRYVTLTHNSNNLYADAATSKPLHGGLSQQGKDMILELNRIGMLVDLSHTSAQTQKQALQTSQAPLIYSHSSCDGLCPSPRNVTDDNLELLKLNRGLIMISFLRDLTATTPEDATLDNVADHIIYAGQKIGYEHVGIGSDFDGFMTGPRGLEDVSKFPALVEQLARRGLNEQDIKGIAGLNLIRVLSEAEDVSDRLKKAGQRAMVDVIKPVWSPEVRAQIWRTRLDQRARGGF
ncbi:membrane dipeptidase GliJ [Elsinoe ampelina]|uniref:Dipeptidase n=1 Tax=Elsinoe ampelina TaxID=302913 RepID=A0A6A6G0F0_9PEZI|nr:membrane dipeptidase GliJ [Elsinoe ampelina]